MARVIGQRLIIKAGVPQFQWWSDIALAMQLEMPGMH